MLVRKEWQLWKYIGLWGKADELIQPAYFKDALTENVYQDMCSIEEQVLLLFP